ncbi:flagellar hook-associated protein FlgL [Photobacterium damselae]|uniref:flagellar hook-associated protein FlgL n=1 Tax=Photobacterium damselae TaxID=38293 RepID=UPI0023418C75|nr:flagellar hook-associated protein FlgL [Photobacterium damselae]MDC4168783.1 flagellar hook-associated protein FlgL [Photobacterium damselae]
MSRISTLSQYNNLTSNLMRKQTQLSNTNNQLATGKRVDTSGDDPVSSISIQNYKQQLTQIGQYKDAITLANNRLGVLETNIAGVEDNLDVTKQKVLGMLNGAMAANDRKAFKDELQSLYDGLLSLANSKDEAGNYIFAGNQMDTKPFIEKDGYMTYQGDSQSRQTQIDSNMNVKTSLPGDQVFMDIPNPYGDFRPNFAGLTEGSKAHVLSADISDFSKAKAIQVSFSDGGTTAGPNGETVKVTNYTLSIDGTEVVKDQPYDPEKGIEYTGSTAGDPTLNLKFAEMQDGDTITLQPAQSFNIFDSIQAAITYADAPTSSPEAQANLQRVIDDLDAGFVHMNQQRSEVGSIMKQVERQQEQHLDFELTLNTAHGGLEDLDYSSAVLDLNQQAMALQASQAAFSQTKNLSLFNYL